MPQVIKSGASVDKAKKSVDSAQGGGNNTKLMAAIAACVFAVLLLGYIGYKTFSKPAAALSDTGKVAPPPGYPDKFPYNMKLWQDGKLHGAGFPLPPKLGGTPPPGATPAAGQPGG